MPEIDEIVWTAAALRHLQQTYERLEEIQEARGDLFVGVLDHELDLLKLFPEMAPSFDGPLRRLLIKRSPFGMFYRVHGRRLVILALLDLRQDPDVIRRELGQ